MKVIIEYGDGNVHVYQGAVTQITDRPEALMVGSICDGFRNVKNTGIGELELKMTYYRNPSLFDNRA